jgi:hypothetical protein
MTASTQYFLEYNDNFPFTVNASSRAMGICSWSYGGKTNDDEQQHYWKNYLSSVFYIAVDTRPRNPYLMTTTNLRDTCVNGILEKKTEIPVCQCPADRSSNQRGFNNPSLAHSPISCYDDTGTSYPYNLHGLTGTNKRWRRAAGALGQ